MDWRSNPAVIFLQLTSNRFWQIVRWIKKRRHGFAWAVFNTEGQLLTSVVEVTETYEKLSAGWQAWVSVPIFKKKKRRVCFSFQSTVVFRLHLKAYFEVLTKSVWPNQNWHCGFCPGCETVNQQCIVKRPLSMTLRECCLEHCGNTGCQGCRYKPSRPFITGLIPWEFHGQELKARF